MLVQLVESVHLQLHLFRHVEALLLSIFLGVQLAELGLTCVEAIVEGLDLVLDFNLLLVESGLIWSSDLWVVFQLGNDRLQGDVGLTGALPPLSEPVLLPLGLVLLFLLELQWVLVNQIFRFFLLLWFGCLWAFLWLSLVRIFSGLFGGLGSLLLLENVNFVRLAMIFLSILFWGLVRFFGFGFSLLFLFGSLFLRRLL